jgi:hypothetical protein
MAEPAQPLEVRLSLFGEKPVPAQLSVTMRPRWLRRARSVGVLLGSWALMPIVFFIPPHAEWLVVLFFGGIYLARREWTAEFVARSFAGVCPRCAAPLRLKAGTTLQLPHDIACRSCRRTASLEAGRVGDVEMAGGTTTVAADAAPPPDLDVEALQEYWRKRNSSSVWSPASSDWRGWERPR